MIVAFQSKFCEEMSRSVVRLNPCIRGDGYLIVALRACHSWVKEGQLIPFGFGVIYLYVLMIMERVLAR